MRRFPLVLTLLAAGPACSSQKPTAPTVAVTADVAGLWADGAGAGVLRWDLHQSGAVIQGIESSTAGPDGGTITGTVSGNVFTLEEEMQRTRDGGFLRYRVHGQLTVNRGSMSGQLTYVPLFDARTITQDVSFVRLITRP